MKRNAGGTNRIIASAALIICALSIPARTGSIFTDIMLFDYAVQNNDLPYGEYMMVRSYRNVTQLLVSTDVNTLYLYTDRDNCSYGDIHATGYSRLDSIIITPPPMEEVEFDRTIQSLLIHGDMREASSMRYPGLNAVLELIKSGIVKINRSEYDSVIQTGRIPGMESYVLSFSFMQNKLTMRYDTASGLRPLYQVYIDECHDDNITGIIKKFIAGARK